MRYGTEKGGIAFTCSLGANMETLSVTRVVRCGGV